MRRDKYFVVDIQIHDEGFGLNPFFSSSFRSIQTYKEKTVRELVKDIIHLVEKYDKKGCHIGR